MELSDFDLILFELEGGYLRQYEKLTADRSEPYDKYDNNAYYNSREHQTEFNRVLNKIIIRNGLPLNGHILDISGGPGGVAELLGQHAAQYGGKVYVTELTPRSVAYMKKRLSVRVEKYDFNNDDLADIFETKFDVILVRGCINYCTEMAKFIESLRKVINPNGLVFVSSYLPTLGTLLRWQFDVHFCTALYNPETIARFFSEGGFRIKMRYEAERIHYMEGFHILLQLFSQKYVHAAKHLPINHELMEKYAQVTFQFKG